MKMAAIMCLRTIAQKFWIQRKVKTLLHMKLT